MRAPRRHARKAGRPDGPCTRLPRDGDDLDARRGRPHARHGIRAADPTHRREGGHADCSEAPDAHVLGHLPQADPAHGDGVLVGLHFRHSRPHRLHYRVHHAEARIRRGPGQGAHAPRAPPGGARPHARLRGDEAHGGHARVSAAAQQPDGHLYPRRPLAARTRGRPLLISRRQDAGARSDGRCGSRPRHSERCPRDQLRLPRRHRRLRAPHRPDGACGAQRPRDLLPERPFQQEGRAGPCRDFQRKRH
mmetsp:Transcript_41350/g.86606  ORF Transcript_41350/g.86606 Transcript_41350/m.86606 type:complete len:249 (+) Transcript_41350:607-1353(+)